MEITHADYLSELRALVDSIDAHKGPWYKDGGGQELEDGVIEMPYVETDPLASRAMKFLYDNNLIQAFDWGNWEEGRSFFTKEDPSKYNNLDQEWVLKLLTAVARNSRFNEGAWADLFESGDAQKLFKRLLQIEESK